MSRRVAARMKGDNYQSRFFWYQAARLLFQDSWVERVVLEHDTVPGVDDVVVYYKTPGILDAGRRCTAEYFQVKYHVDHRDVYSSDAMVDPTFIKARNSLLQRFHGAYQAERERCPGLILCLVSNWAWRAGDPLATAIRDCNGALPDAFFSSGPRSALGMVRNKWRDAIGTTDEEFADFARRLRLKFNYFSRGDLLEALDDRLYRAGLQPLEKTRELVPYDDLAMKFIMSGRTEFDATSLRDTCRAEGLLINQPQPRDVRALGIRSFMRFTEHIEEECESFVCLAEHFDGRAIRDPALWGSAVYPTLDRLLMAEEVRQVERHLLLECHSSVSYAVGYVLHRSSGACVYPLQKGRSRVLWKPADSTPARFFSSQWETIRKETSSGSDGLVVSVSITHDIRQDVEDFLNSKGQLPGVLLDVRLTSGVGPSTVRGPDHAIALAEQLQQMVRAERRGAKQMPVGLFAAAPNSFMFFLGQLGRGMDPIQLYEYDFEGGTGYTPSLSFPPGLSKRV